MQRLKQFLLDMDRRGDLIPAVCFIIAFLIVFPVIIHSDHQYEAERAAQRDRRATCEALVPGAFTDRQAPIIAELCRRMP